jgi:thiamine biosynthesis protein ThiS
MGDSIEIIINGETQVFDGAVSVADLLARLGLPEKKIAVEHNLEIVPKSAYASHMVEAGDRIEIVHFIGGG